MRHCAGEPVRRTSSATCALQIDEDAEYVRIVGSNFTKCRNYCSQPCGDSIERLNSNFHDLIESDAVKGGESRVTIADNIFVRAFPGEAHEHHNDFLQIRGGGPWLIARNHFGPREFGAAQVFVTSMRLARAPERRQMSS
jgi:hypothetical protein